LIFGRHSPARQQPDQTAIADPITLRSSLDGYGRIASMPEMKSRAGQVSVGDSFTKVSGHYRTVYVVKSVVEAYGIPPHVRLVAEGQNDGMLMSVSALLDSHFWLRVPSERK
jgi:hypothetical protein